MREHDVHLAAPLFHSSKTNSVCMLVTHHMLTTIKATRFDVLVLISLGKDHMTLTAGPSSLATVPTEAFAQNEVPQIKNIR
eukprot:4993753-Amphidinium_carterae.1